MKKISTLCALAAITVSLSTSHAADFGKVYNGTDVIHGTVIPNGDGSCGTLNLNSDGTYENGYCWQYGGCVAPNYGAFAECYSIPIGGVCSVTLDLAQVGSYSGQRADIYVWAEGGGIPGNVVGRLANFDVGSVAFWPNFSRSTAAVSACVHDDFWVGYWGNWPGGTCAYFIGADLDGVGGCPLTNIAPGIGYPTGWNSVSVVWGPTQTIGIGCETTNCGFPVGVEPTTWGAVKGLYNR